MPSRDVILFGASSSSSLAYYCLTHDSPLRVRGFTVDAAYLRQPTHEGLPVLPFETLTQSHPPGSVDLLLPLGFTDINGVRRRRCEQALAMGYALARYVSSRALLWPDFQAGENCLVYEGAIVQPYARIGRNVILRSGVHVSHHCTIGDHAFLAAGATLGGEVSVGEQAFIGLGAVVRDGVRIAERSFIGAGAVVVADTEADGVYVGNPARKLARSAAQVTAA